MEKLKRCLLYGFLLGAFALVPLGMGTLSAEQVANKSSGYEVKTQTAYYYYNYNHDGYHYRYYYYPREHRYHYHWWRR